MTTDPPSFPARPPLNYAGPYPYPPEPAPPRKRGRGLIGWTLFVVFAVLLFMLMRNQGRTFATIPYNEFDARLKPVDAPGPGSTPDRIEWLRLEGDDLYGKFVKTEDIPEKGAVTYFKVVVPQGMGSDYRFFRELVTRIGLAKVEVEPSNNLIINILLPLIPWLLIFSFVWYLLRSSRKRHSGAQLIISGPGRWIPDPPPASQVSQQ